MLEKDFENRFFIITTDDDPTQAQFSIEETKLIKKLIQSGAQDNPLRSSLLKKLSLNSEMDSMPRLFLKARLGQFVDQIAEAIRNKNQIVLKNYHSANSNEIRDRLVEPIHFGDNYQSIIALDTQDKICKQFKLDRIGELIEIGTKYQHETLHKKNQTDIFGFTGDSNTWITFISVCGRIYFCVKNIHCQSRTQKESKMAISFMVLFPTSMVLDDLCWVSWMKFKSRGQTFLKLS